MPGIPKSELMSVTVRRVAGFIRKKYPSPNSNAKMFPMYWRRKHIHNFSMDSRYMASRVQGLKWNQQMKIYSTVGFYVAEDSASLLIDQIGQGEFFILSMSRSLLEMWQQEVLTCVFSFQISIFCSNMIFDASRV